MSSDGRGARWVLLAACSAACFAAGYGVRSLATKPPPPDYEIREGRSGLTNPLLDCEVASYRPGRELRPFKDRIDRLVADALRDGAATRISVYFRDLDNGPWFGIGEDDTFTPASLLKVPTIIAALAQAERNPAFLARTVRFLEFPGGAPAGGYVPTDPLVPGSTYTVDELLLRAAANSDNAAVALLAQQIEPQVLDWVFRDLGLPIDPRQSERRTLSAKQYGQLFRVLYNASFLGRAMSERALGYFTRAAFADGLVGGVPTGTVVAHKFGIYSMPWQKGAGQLHDCGIVYEQRRPYFLCVMTEGRDVDLLALKIREISRAVSEELRSQTAVRLPGQAGAEPFPP